MNIEVVCNKNEATKVKGDLLEKLSKDLLEALSYDVIEEIRFTGVELDLLCKHRVSGKEIYVECKAQKEKIGAPILRQLIGTVYSYGYTEGWLVTTSEFGKEAKGFIEMWKGKGPEESSKLSFYSPQLIIESLQRASVICDQPISLAEEYIGGSEFLGEWILLISNYGRYWCVYTLQGGAPHGVLLFNASNGRQIHDEDTLNNIGQLDTSISNYNFKIGVMESTVSQETIPITSPSVVEVQTGDSWDDYRPARPQDFVGREEDQKEIINFLKNANKKLTTTRIFAITGNSGLGKSSLIAKLRDRTRNKFYKNKLFTYAVDIRGAKSPSYITASLLKCLRLAQKANFGDSIDLQLTHPSSPLSSPTISTFLESVEKKGQVLCLVFDQFEELYSKPELFGVFETAKALMLDVASHKGNLVLGFAWKTDSTTQQDHPAYHMWHELADYRKVYKLDVFDSGEISKSITTFEKEVKQKLPLEIRHQITHSCQGFPWLLKKLCINLYENLKKGEGAESILVDLDVRRLFESDLDLLTPAEHTCLKLIAEKAPADWSEIIELSGIAVLNALVHKRLVIKSGDRLNIYWDIFKDYLLTGKVPIVPFNYIPTSDIFSMLKVFQALSPDEFIGSCEISKATTLTEKTVGNIGADLVMFSLAERKGTAFKCHRDLNDHSDTAVLQKLREKLGKHSLKLALYKNKAGKTIDQSIITSSLRGCLPKAKYSDKTWKTYANRLTNLFSHSGYLVRVGNDITVQDIGAPIADFHKIARKGKKRGVLFSAPASPAMVCETLIHLENTTDHKIALKKGLRNSLTVLKRFELISISNDTISIIKQSIDKYGGYREATWTSAKNEPVIFKCIEKIEEFKNISGYELGEYISNEYQANWSEASMTRNGNSLKQWATWIKTGIENSEVPSPPGRIKNQSNYETF